MTNTLPEDRIDYRFKLLYAIGIVLVVSNHCMGGGISLFYEFFPAYAFHLGLFMFSSGYFYKDNVENNIRKYICKKIRTLILPMYLWNFAYAVFAQIMSMKGFFPETGWGGIGNYLLCRLQQDINIYII